MAEVTEKVILPKFDKEKYFKDGEIVYGSVKKLRKQQIRFVLTDSRISFFLESVEQNLNWHQSSIR